MVTEFSASPTKTVMPLALMLALAFGCSALAALSWDNPWLSGVLLLPVLFGLIGVAILLYRMVMRPVMVRISPDGLYLKRLSTTIPWDAIEKIERVRHGRETLFSIIEVESGHPVFDERPLLLGAAMNEKVGLPALSVAMSQYDGTPELFEAAVIATAAIEFVDGAPTDFDG